MSTFEPNDGFDELLRSSMHDEADTVMPAGDGLSRIQQRVSSRRARQRWLRPTMALGSAAAVALVTIGAYAAVHDSGKARVEVPQTTPSATNTPTTEPTPSRTTPPSATVAFPKRAIFPFTSASDERAFEQEAASGTNPWKDPAAVATSWVTNFLQLPSVSQFVQKTTFAPGRVDVTLGRMQSDAGSQRQISVTTVHLVKYGKVWLVTGASDDSGLLRISSPKAGATVTSPVSASGPGGGVHRAARVEVRDAVTPTKYGQGNDGSFGSTQGWSTSVSFQSPSNPVGVLLVVESSDADGLPLRVTAEQVRFATSTVVAGPQYFYGIKNGRVTKFHASDGSSVDYLTGGGTSDPQLSWSGEDVYYLQAKGSCTNTISAVGTGADRTPRAIASPDAGYVITGYAVGPQPSGASGAAQSAVAYYEHACNGGSPAAKLVMIDAAGQHHVIDFQSEPPAVIGDPSWEPGSPAAWNVRYLDAIVQTGNESSLARYDTTQSASPTPSRSACPGYDVNNGRPWAMETDASGTVWFATQTGSSMQVVKCVAGSQTSFVAFTIPGNRQPKDVDVASDGSVLLTDFDGHVWRWDGSGDAHQLSPSQPVNAVTW